MPAALASRYARVLADLAMKPGAGVDPHAVMHEIEAFEEALGASHDLRTALESPAIPPGRKRAVIARLAKTLPLSSLVRRFLAVLVDHRRTSLLPEIRPAFEAVMDERLGVVRVDVVSARELTAAQREDLAASVGRLSGKRARAHFAVREELLGGAVARVGSTVFDGSVRGQLEALKQRLAGAGE
jgi:F-type H+-transporting ATPase subunit delta